MVLEEGAAVAPRGPGGLPAAQREGGAAHRRPRQADPAVSGSLEGLGGGRDTDIPEIPSVLLPRLRCGVCVCRSVWRAEPCQLTTSSRRCRREASRSSRGSGLMKALLIHVVSPQLWPRLCPPPADL